MTTTNITPAAKGVPHPSVCLSPTIPGGACHHPHPAHMGLRHLWAHSSRHEGRLPGTLCPQPHWALGLRTESLPPATQSSACQKPGVLQAGRSPASDAVITSPRTGSALGFSKPPLLSVRGPTAGAGGASTSMTGSCLKHHLFLSLPPLIFVMEDEYFRYRFW